MFEIAHSASSSTDVDALKFWLVQYDKFYGGEKQEDASEYLMMLIELINKGWVPYCGSNDNNSTGVSLSQGWGQIRFIKYKYKNLDFSNTNTNILFNFHSNTNTLIQIQIQIHSTKYICRNCSDPKWDNSMNPKIYAHGLCFLMFRWHLKLTPLHFRKFHWH